MADILVELAASTLECGVCMSTYNDPRDLPCHHVFCKGCLEGVARAARKKNEEKNKNEDVEIPVDRFDCPQCRKPVTLPPNGADGFPVSMQALGIMDFIKEESKGTVPKKKGNCEHCLSEKGSKFCSDCNNTFCTDCTGLHKGCTTKDIDPPPIMAEIARPLPPPIEAEPVLNVKRCLMHNEPLDVYCEECKEIICSRCVKRLAPHTKHQPSCIPLKDVLDKYRELLKDRLNTITNEKDFVYKQLKLIMQQESEIAEQGNTVKAQIHSRTEFLVESIQESEKELSEKVDKVISSKLHLLDERRESIQTTIEDLKNLKERIKQCIKNDDQEQLLKAKQWIQIINQMLNNDVSKFTPPRVFDFEFIIEEVPDNFNHIGNLSATFETLNKSCDIKVLDQFLSLDDDEKPEVTFVSSIKYSSFPFLVIPPKKIKCSIQLPVSTDEPVEAKVSSGDSPGQYQLKFRPTTNGYYKLSFSINGVEAEEQTVLVPFNPVYFESVTPTNTIYSVPKPVGIAVTRDKQIIIVNEDHELVIMNEDGGNKRVYNRFGGKSLTNPRDVAITSDGCLLVTVEHCILKVTMNGKLLETIGKKGKRPLGFDCPFGMKIDNNTGKIYVAEVHNHRIHVLNSNYTFSHFIGSHGWSKDQFQHPNGVDLDSHGNVYIADTYNNRVQKFTSQGSFLYNFGSKGGEPGQLNIPERVVVKNDYVYVTEHNNSRVSVFTTEGKFMRCFGRCSNEGGMDWPRGLTFDEDGSLYVCDFRQECIIKY